MMQILKAGGIDILTDDIRKPDANNIKGYYEYEKVKSLTKDCRWMNEAEGKAVKIIAQLIPYISPEFEYKIIFMRRNPDEILDSQEKMIKNLGGKQASLGKDAIKKVYETQLKKVEKFIAENKNISSFDISFNEIISGKTELISSMDSALNLKLNVEEAMRVIDSTLYRSRV